MKFFDKTLVSIYKIFNNFVNFLKKITRIEIIKKLEKLTEKINSAALIVSSIMVTIVGLALYARYGASYFLPFAIFGPIVVLFTAYLANDFHNACSDLIDSNKTSLGNNAILKFGAIISLFLSAVFFIAGVVAIFNGSLVITIYSLLASLFFFISAGTQFNPSLLNVEITKQSTSGEDFISIFSLNLKSMVYFEKILSTILIVLGNVCLLASLLGSEYKFFMYGTGFISAGIAYPIIVYILFTVLWFFNSLFLGIFSLARKK